MELPEFVGPHADLAALRWAQLSFSRRVIAGLNSAAKKLLLRQTELYAPMDFTEEETITLAQLSMKNQINNIETNYSELDYLFDSLMDISRMPESLALGLARKYGSVEKIILVHPKELAEITYHNNKRKLQKIGLNMANKILSHLGHYA